MEVNFNTLYAVAEAMNKEGEAKNNAGDLIEEAPYLVISNTKKGVREFKQNTFWRNHEHYLGDDYNWAWGKLQKAERFEMEMLPKMLEAVKNRRCVTVCVVRGNLLQVLRVTEYPI